MNRKYVKVTRFISTGITFLGVIMILWGYTQGYFTSIEGIQDYIASAGVWASVLFVLAQILQTILPIIPGGLCLVGILLFGSVGGMLYNYIGIVVGSFLAFWLAKVHGRKIIDRLFPVSSVNKYLEWTEQKLKFKNFFILAILFPFAPDDLLCFLAGTTKMEWKEYIPIILLGKPISIATYSFGLTGMLSVIF